MKQQLGKAGELLIKSYEKLALLAYYDQGGVITNGWGHTGKDVFPGQRITENKAQTWFYSDTQEAMDAVNELVTVPLNQNQFDALVTFVFNIGRTQFATSTLLKLLNSRNYKAAADQFARWNLVDGKQSNGLSRRRAAERALFETLLA